MSTSTRQWARSCVLFAGLAAIAAGLTDTEADFPELGQIVAGLKPGRERDDETILFWHRGLSLSDIALGHAILAKAAAMGPAGPLRELPASWSLARTTLQAIEAGAIDTDDRIVRADDALGVYPQVILEGTESAVERSLVCRRREGTDDTIRPSPRDRGRRRRLRRRLGALPRHDGRQRVPEQRPRLHQLFGHLGQPPQPRNRGCAGQTARRHSGAAA